MRKLLALFVAAAVAVSVGAAFGSPVPEGGNGRGPFSNPPCLDEDGNGPDHGHPNENSPKCTGELPNGNPFPPDNGNGDNGNGDNGNGDNGNGDNGNGDNGNGDNGSGDNGCPPATGPISSNLQPLGDADPTGAVNVVLCILSDLGI